VTKTNTWHDQQILTEAKKASASILKVDFQDWDEFLKIDWSLALVVFWRSSSLGQSNWRLKALKNLEKKGKIVINQGWTKWPKIVYKSFQQKRLASFLGENSSIKTFVFKSKKELINHIKKGNELNFPIIKKPDLGFQGIGVSKIRNLGELERFSDEEISKSIFQNFIENDGDYRVLVLGGRPLGIMKRVAKRGGFLNNLSQGGVGLKVNDKRLRYELMEKATKIAAVFDLGFCGVDLIVDKKTSRSYFLEINTVPQWQGFQKINKINIGKAIVKYCQDLGERNKKRLAFQIEKFYSEAPYLSEDKQFHFYSRLYLWTKKKKYYNSLLKLEKYFLGGKNRKAWDRKIKDLIKQEDFYRKKIINNKIFREKVLANYPRLGLYHELLFRGLMAENIFQVDWQERVFKHIPRKDFLLESKKLLNNFKDLETLSTFAVNYLFLLAFFLKNKNFEREIKDKLICLIKSSTFKEEKCSLKNGFYLLSHCLVAGSEFYSKKIFPEENFFAVVFEKMEKLLQNNFSKISLDNKLEFLVGARLLNKKTDLEEAIQREVEQSWSPIGNFLIDTKNEESKDYSRKDFFSSEHRNVLFLMANYNLLRK